MPQADVVRAALNLYQEALRRPSLIACCLDFSGSMRGKGENALKEAMAFVLRPGEASTMLVQHGREDRIFVLPFDGDVREVIEGTGSEADQARLLAAVQNEQANDGTDIYRCAERAMESQTVRPVLIYPVPTVYSSHPIVSLTEPADRLLPALTDSDLQELAWSGHGFRGALGGIGQGGPAVKGIAPTIESISPMPDASVMLALLERLSASRS